MKVLEVAHAWEGSSYGGAERSAAALTAALKDIDGVQAQLVACVKRRDTAGNSHFGFDEATGALLIDSATDWDTFGWKDERMADSWHRLLSTIAPSVVHLHHYAQTGIALPTLIRHQFTGTAVVVTLHEYLAICARSGQLLDRDGRLCSGPAPRKCARCMQWSVDNVSAREHYIRSALNAVDAFISPSEFLAERYLEWGLPSDRIHVIPNALTPPVAPAISGRSDSGVLRVSFLGQHTPFKGLGLLLDALSLIDVDTQQRLLVNIFGSGADRFGPEFEQSITTHPSADLPSVRFRGSYTNDRVGTLLSETDVLVVPSMWFENSPVVIEEALAMGVPVLCSDIGGMREKVRDGIDGWHFRTGDVASLAGALTRLTTEGTGTLTGVMRTPMPAAQTAAAHIDLFRSILSQVPPSSSQ